MEITHLSKTYGPVVAVDDVSLSVTEGEIFGILGPNGAGKTTAIQCAIGLRDPDAGSVRLLGLDPRADRAEVHELVGVQLQSSAFPAKLRVGEILAMGIGRLAFFPLMFFAGLWLPRALMPSLLQDISNYTPLGAAVQAIQDSMLQGFPPVAPLLVLAGYAVVFGFLARRFFRWE